MVLAEYFPSAFVRTATAHASILIHAVSTLTTKPRFNGLLILEWCRC